MLDYFAEQAVKVNEGYDYLFMFTRSEELGSRYICSNLCADAASFSGIGEIPASGNDVWPSDILNASDFEMIHQGMNLDGLTNASGGFVLYPSKPNTNMIKFIYTK